MLLKNIGEMPFQNNYNEDPHELPEPSSSFRKLPSTTFGDYTKTPVPALLQNRKPSNIVHQSGRLPISREDIERLMLEGQRGQTPLGEPIPPPMPSQ